MFDDASEQAAYISPDSYAGYSVRMIGRPNILGAPLNLIVNPQKIGFELQREGRPSFYVQLERGETDGIYSSPCINVKINIPGNGTSESGESYLSEVSRQLERGLCLGGRDTFEEFVRTPVIEDLSIRESLREALQNFEATFYQVFPIGILKQLDMDLFHITDKEFDSLVQEMDIQLLQLLSDNVARRCLYNLRRLDKELKNRFQNEKRLRLATVLHRYLLTQSINEPWRNWIDQIYSFYGLVARGGETRLAQNLKAKKSTRKIFNFSLMIIGGMLQYGEETSYSGGLASKSPVVRLIGENVCIDSQNPNEPWRVSIRAGDLIAFSPRGKKLRVLLNYLKPSSISLGKIPEGEMYPY